MGTKFSIKEALDGIDNEVDQESFELWGNVNGAGPMGGTDLFESPAFKEIIFILIANPILVSPVLNFLRLKQAQMSRAQLEVLYTPEELAELYKKVEAES